MLATVSGKYRIPMAATRWGTFVIDRTYLAIGPRVQALLVDEEGRTTPPLPHPGDIPTRPQQVAASAEGIFVLGTDAAGAAFTVAEYACAE